VVVNHGTPDETLRTVGALHASARPVDLVVVVDNGSQDDSVARLRAARSGIRLLEIDHNLGFAGGANVGIRAALEDGADLVALVNSDAIVTPDCLGHLEAALDAAPAAGIVGPVVVEAADPALIASAGLAFSPRSGRVREREHGRRLVALAGRRPEPVDGVSGCLMLVRRDVFGRVGLLAEDYFFAFEDLDFCLRVRGSGYETVLVPGAVVLHEGSRTIGRRSPRRLYFAARNHLLLADRLAPMRRPLGIVRAIGIVALNTGYALTSAEAPRLAGLWSVARGVWDHARGRYDSDSGP
jgi:GT2 family glycosyltransferase